MSLIDELKEQRTEVQNRIVESEDQIASYWRAIEIERKMIDARYVKIKDLDLAIAALSPSTRGDEGLFASVQQETSPVQSATDQDKYPESEGWFQYNPAHIRPAPSAIVEVVYSDDDGTISTEARYVDWNVDRLTHWRFEDWKQMRDNPAQVAAEVRTQAEGEAGDDEALSIGKGCVEIPEGFIPWSGATAENHNPDLPPNTLVEALYRDGSALTDFVATHEWELAEDLKRMMPEHANDFDSAEDIIAYRIITSPQLPTQLDSQAQEEGEPAEIISTLTGDPAIEPESGLHEEPPAPQPQATSEQGDNLAKVLGHQAAMASIEREEKARPRWTWLYGNPYPKKADGVS